MRDGADFDPALDDSPEQLTGTPRMKTTKKGELKDRIENNAVVFFLGALVTGFIAGIGVYKAAQEIGQLETVTKSELADLRESDGLAKERVRVAEGAVQKALADMAELRNKHRVFELFGADFFAYRSFDLRKEIGAKVILGAPGNSPYSIIIEKIDTIDTDDAMVHLKLTHPDFPHSSCTIGVPLRIGGRVGLATKKVDFDFVIEDDSFTKIRLGVVLKPGSGEEEEPTVIFGEQGISS